MLSRLKVNTEWMSKMRVRRNNRFQHGKKKYIEIVPYSMICSNLNTFNCVVSCVRFVIITLLRACWRDSCFVLDNERMWDVDVLIKDYFRLLAFCANLLRFFCIIFFVKKKLAINCFFFVFLFDCCFKNEIFKSQKLITCRNKQKFFFTLQQQAAKIDNF